MDKRLVQYLAGLGAGPSSLIGWTITAVERDGELAGFCISKGPEVHILPLIEGRSLTRRNILAFLEPILAEFGYCTTRVPRAETNHRLRTALGFEETWHDASFTYFALTHLKYARTQKGAAPCL